MFNVNSPLATESTTEAALAAVSKHPRVTLQALEDNIKEVEYVTHKASSGQVLRWAVIICQNGFAVTGDPSAAVSPENDNEVFGKEIAFKNAKEKLWAFMGYDLKAQLARGTI